jgi:hypothetical protein
MPLCVIENNSKHLPEPKASILYINSENTQLRKVAADSKFPNNLNNTMIKSKENTSQNSNGSNELLQNNGYQQKNHKPVSSISITPNYSKIKLKEKLTDQMIVSLRRFSETADSKFKDLISYSDSYFSMLASPKQSLLNKKKQVRIAFSDFQKVKRLEDILVTKNVVKNLRKMSKKTSNLTIVKQEATNKDTMKIVPELFSIEADKSDPTGQTLNLTWQLIDNISKKQLIEESVVFNNISEYEMFCHRTRLDEMDMEEVDVDLTNPLTWTKVRKFFFIPLALKTFLISQNFR